MLLSITNTGDGDFVIQDPAGVVNFSMTVGPDDTGTATITEDLLSRLQPYLDDAVTAGQITYTTAGSASGEGAHRVRAASTGALTLEDEQTVDGVALVAGDRVLVKNQVAGATNGIYVVVDGGPWTRAEDFDSSEDATPNIMIPVAAGTTLADTLWQLTTNDPIVLGTTALVFAQVLGSSLAAGTIAGTPTFSAAAQVGDARVVTVTLRDHAGTALAAAAKATVWLSDTAGAAPSAVAPSGGTAVSAGVALVEHTADVLLEAVSTALGVIGVTITEAGEKSYFVNVAFGTKVASSAEIVFSSP
jgi:hypothetical protein